MSIEKLNTLLQLSKLNKTRNIRELTSIEKLEYKALLVTMPNE